MIHIMDGDWSILDEDTQLDCMPLYRLSKARKAKPIEIPVHEVAYKPTDSISSVSIRYLMADVNQPSLLCIGMGNPYGKPYRMLDGRHRLLKRINKGQSTVLAYVVEEEDAMKFVSSIRIT